MSAAPDFIERRCNMAKLPAGYRQRADGKIEARFTINGRRYSCYASTVKECRIKETELRKQIRNGMYASNRNITLNQYFDEWERSRQCSVKESTQIRVRREYNGHIRDALGGSVRDIPLNDTIKDILRKQREKMAIFNGNIIDLARRFLKVPTGLMYRM